MIKDCNLLNLHPIECNIELTFTLIQPMDHQKTLGT